MGAISSSVGQCLRRAVRLFVRIYYPRIEVTGRERIPASGPVLLVANHANSLIDPVMIGIAAVRPVRFLAKAPLFDVPVLGPVMRALGMLPAFRGMDDPSQIKRNLDTLTAGAEYLVKGDAVGLFPEGKSHDSLKLEMIRSGAARMALQAVKDGAQDLLIVPLGINYERKDQFQSAVWIRVGEPIHANRLIAEHGDEERRALRTMTNRIEQHLKQVAIHLTEPRWERFLCHFEVIFPPALGENAPCTIEPFNAAPLPPSGHPLPIGWGEGRGEGCSVEVHRQPRGPIATLRQRNRIAEAMNYFRATDSPRAEALAALMEQHCQALSSAGLDMSSPIVRLRGWKLCRHMSWAAIALAFGIVPVLLGTLHHLIPFLLVRTLAGKLQVPGKTTTSLARLGLGVPIYILWYFCVWWWMSDRFGAGAAWTWTLLMPLAGMFALSYWRRAREAGLLWWRELRLLFSRVDLEKFRQDQLALCDRLKQMADEYRQIHPHAPSSPILPGQQSKT